VDDIDSDSDRVDVSKTTRVKEMVRGSFRVRVTFIRRGKTTNGTRATLNATNGTRANGWARR